MSPQFSQSTLSRKPTSCDPARRPRVLPYSSVLNGMASQANSWKQPLTCPVLTPSETPPMSFTPKRSEVGVTVTPRFPLGFLPPIGLASMNKTQAYSSSLGPYFSTNMTYSLNPTQTTMFTYTRQAKSSQPFAQTRRAEMHDCPERVRDRSAP
ncbi:hypothetical protein AHF37_03998 [Paragonimus kellicotti]|nr:hypothetical protein AHF37_03998 [Paragonimus kellicotti]